MRGCSTGRFLESEYSSWRVWKLKDECPSRKTSWRAKYTWPALQDGMTLKEWDIAAREIDPRGKKSEGVPTQYPCELRKKGYIDLEPVEQA